MQLQGEGAATAPAAPASGVAFDWRRGLFGLLVKNFVLSVITLSLYRFWARTDLRRFFWSSISVGGDRLEYTGQGIEIFLGFLVALAVLAPLGLAYNQLALLVQPSLLEAGLLWVAYLLVLTALVHVARYRARRYRLSRTRWRGIRLGQDGSTLAYLGQAMGWSLLQLATLGFATPWKRAALRGYIVRHSWFGDRRFGFAPLPSLVLPQWLAVMALGLVPPFAVGALNAGAIAHFLERIAASATAPHVTIAQPGESPMISLPLEHSWILWVGGLLWAAAFATYRAAEARMFAAATTLGTARLQSSLNAGVIIVAVLVLVVVVGVAALVLLPLAFAVSGAVVHGPGGPSSAIFAWLTALLAGIGSVGFIYYLCMNMLVKRTVLARFCETLRIDNLASLDDVRQSAVAAPRRGEGLADSLEIGGD